MLQNEASVAKIGFDTAENEPSKVCRPIPTYRSPLGHKFGSVNSSQKAGSAGKHKFRYRLRNNYAKPSFVIGCIEADFCNHILIGNLSPRSTEYTSLHSFGIHRRNMGKKRTWPKQPRKKEKTGNREASKRSTASHFELQRTGLQEKIARENKE